MTLDPKRFFAELQRRNVYKAAVAYGVLGWLLVQVATQVFPFFEVPNWVIRLVVILLLLGFPVAVALAWIFELTAEGLKRTEEVPPFQSVTRRTGRKLDFLIIGILLVVIGLMLFQHYGNPGPSPKSEATETSIAVLPFADIGATQDQQYFSEGLTEQIINALGRIRDLSVVARTSAQAFRGKEMDLREVGRILRVNHILEGSVRRGLAKVRIEARLVNVTNGYQLWSGSYDSAESDFFALQSDVAQKVAHALQKQLRLEDGVRLAKPATRNPEAYDLYLRGRYMLNKRTVDSMKKALTIFRKALDEDAKFALGHVGVADSYILLGKIGAIRGDEAAARAWPEVTEALELDPELAEGYVSRGILLTDFEWNWAAAEADFDKALALNPNNAAAHHWYARHLAEIGRAQEAIAQMNAAQKLDPLSPTLRVSTAKILFVAERYEEAIAPCRQALELEPRFASAFSLLGQAYAHQGKAAESIEAARKYVELSDGSGWAQLELAYALAVAGQVEEAERIVQQVTVEPRQYSPYDMATIRSATRNYPEAMRWLERAITERSVDAMWLLVDPRLQNLRATAEFQEMIKTLKLSPPKPVVGEEGEELKPSRQTTPNK